jgi:hypothetical protein
VEQTLEENAPMIEENEPAGQGTQEDVLKYVPAGQGEHRDPTESAVVSTAPGVLVCGQPELSRPKGAYMKLGVHKGVLAM